VPQNYAEAMKWYRKAADQGNAAAQNNLGVMYDEGQGVPQNYAEAMKWYRKAADRGFDKAQYNLGNMYKNGQGVPQNATLPADVQREIVGARRALRRDRSRVRPAQGRVCVGAITRMTRIDLRIMFYRRHDAAVVLWLIGLAGSRRK
jgi:TPR repeat protein